MVQSLCASVSSSHPMRPRPPAMLLVPGGLGHRFAFCRYRRFFGLRTLLAVCALCINKCVVGSLIMPRNRLEYNVVELSSTGKLRVPERGDEPGVNNRVAFFAVPSRIAECAELLGKAGLFLLPR
jgi:hypothetical protein